MLNENIKALRKAKGLTQEDFAARLHVVRQTISKWERGLSVPDSEMLIKISELLDVSVSDLLGTELPDHAAQTDIAGQLAIINEQLASRNRRGKLLMKIFVGVIMGIIALHILLAALVSLFSVSTDIHFSETEQYQLSEKP